MQTVSITAVKAVIYITENRGYYTKKLRMRVHAFKTNLK